MIRHTSRRFGILLSLLTALASLTSAGAGPKVVQTLDAKDKQTKRLEVSQSFAGPRSTLIFYTFASQKAVLRLNIDNKSKKFPVTGVLHVFPDDTTEEGLKKWLNNQHSDGLFPDVPNPVATHKIPAGKGKVTARKFVDSSSSRTGKFDNYSVEFQVAGIPAFGKLKIKDFTDKATVHLKSE